MYGPYAIAQTTSTMTAGSSATPPKNYQLGPSVNAGDRPVSAGTLASALGELESRISQLSEAIGSLSGQLGPVLDPLPADRADGPLQPSPVAEVLNIIAAMSIRLANQTELVRDLRTRLIV